MLDIVFFFICIFRIGEWIFISYFIFASNFLLIYSATLYLKFDFSTLWQAPQVDNLQLCFLLTCFLSRNYVSTVMQTKKLKQEVALIIYQCHISDKFSWIHYVNHCWNLFHRYYSCQFVRECLPFWKLHCARYIWLMRLNSGCDVLQITYYWRNVLADKWIH